MRATAANAGIELEDGISDRQRAAVEAQSRIRRLSLRAAAAPRLPDPRLPAHGEPGPQHVRGLHGGAERCRRDGDRRHAQLLGRAGGSAARDRSEARPPRDRRLAGAGARPHRAGRRHRRHRNAGRQGHRRDRHRGGAGRAQARLRAARRAAVVLDVRASARRARREGAGRGAHPRPAARRLRIRRRDGGGRRAQSGPDGGLSVLPPVRARPTCW